MVVIVKRRSVPAVSVETDKGDSMAGFDPQTGEPIPDAPVVDPNQPPPGSVTVIQQQPPVAPPTLSPELQALFDAERERVRQEEKNKLYETLEQQRTAAEQQRQQLEVLTQERDQRLAAEAEQQRLASEEAERLRQAEMSAIERMQEIERQADEKLRQANETIERERILRERETAYSEVLQYRAARLAEESDNIMPQFIDFVRGNTREEIDATIADVKGRTDAIMNEIQQTQQQGRQALNMPVSGAPVVSAEALTGADGQRTFTNDDLRNLSDDEYAQYRNQLLGATSQAVRERGVYGA